MCDTTAAHGPATVCSAGKVECHAPSGYSVRDFSAKVTSAGYSPRGKQRDTILAFWEAQGIARWSNGGAGGGGRWLVRDVVNGGTAWLPLAGQAEVGRADVAEFSHVISADNGGAWCGCGVLPERGDVNAARGRADMVLADLPGEARDVLANWGAWWASHAARPASLKRLDAVPA